MLKVEGFLHEPSSRRIIGKPGSDVNWVMFNIGMHLVTLKLEYSNMYNS
jgi:hypothetical protein